MTKLIFKMFLFYCSTLSNYFHNNLLLSLNWTNSSRFIRVFRNFSNLMFSVLKAFFFTISYHAWITRYKLLWYNQHVLILIIYCFSRMSVVAYSLIYFDPFKHSFGDHKSISILPHCMSFQNWMIIFVVYIIE